MYSTVNNLNILLFPMISLSLSKKDERLKCRLFPFSLIEQMYGYETEKSIRIGKKRNSILQLQMDVCVCVCMCVMLCV